MAEHIVDAAGGGSFETISAAVAAAQSGDRVLVRAGTYREWIVLHENVSIIGEGHPVATFHVRVLTSTAPEVRIVGMELRQEPSILQEVVEVDGDTGLTSTASVRLTGPAVGIYGGNLHMENCSIWACQEGALDVSCDATVHLTASHIASTGKCRAVGVNGATAVLTDNEISCSGSDGVGIFNGRATLTHNRIVASGNGVVVGAGGQVELTGNEIARCGGGGVTCTGSATLRDNQIVHNDRGGVTVSHGGRASLADNAIADNREVGVRVEAARAELERNRIATNDGPGIVLGTRAEAVLLANHVQGNTGAGIRVRRATSCIADGNDLHGNSGGPWELPLLGRSRIKRSGNIT